MDQGTNQDKSAIVTQPAATQPDPQAVSPAVTQTVTQPTDQNVTQPVNSPAAVTDAQPVIPPVDSQPADDSVKAQEPASQITQIDSNTVPEVQPVEPSPQPISGAAKEAGPIMDQSVQEEIIRPAEAEPVLAPEVKEAGVETIANTDHVQIQSDLKSAGVTAVKTAVPVPVSLSVAVELPMTKNEARKIQRTHPAVDSVRWLATQIIEQSEKMKKIFQ